MRVPYKTNNNLYKEMIYDSLSGGTSTSYPSYPVYRKPGGGFFKTLKKKGLHYGKAIGKNLLSNLKSDVVKTAAEIGKDVLLQKKDLKSAILNTMKEHSKELLKKGAKTIVDTVKSGGKKGKKGKKGGGKVGKKSGGSRNKKLGIKNASSQRKYQRKYMM